MKKLIAIILALILTLGCAALAEEASVPAGAGALSFATVGEAMNAEGFTGIAGGDDRHCVVAVERDGSYFRLVADMDEESIRLYEATLDYVDADTLEAAFDAYNAYRDTLPFTYEEEITAPRLPREELDALIGKTLLEVEEAGYEFSSFDQGENGEAIYTICSGLYDYGLLLNETYAEYMEHDENGYIGDLTVRSAGFSGLSRNVTDLHYHADGTVDETDDPWAEYNRIMGLITDALSSENPEEAIQALTEAMPEHAEEIRLFVDIFTAMSEQYAE